MTCKVFRFGGVDRAHWNAETRVLTVLQAADQDGTGTWLRILTVEDPTLLEGRRAWRCSLPGPRPIAVEGILYPHLLAAAAGGAGWAAGGRLYVLAELAVSWPQGGAPWAAVWTWPESWQIAPADPLP